MKQIDIVRNEKERLSVWYGRDVLLNTVVLFLLHSSSSEDTGGRTTTALTSLRLIHARTISICRQRWQLITLF